jgi:O-antigen/teichoic acid export membrane protein
LKARKYILNFSSQFVVNIVSQAIGLLTLPYTARVLGAQKFGEYNLASSIASYAGIIASFGFIAYSNREMPRLEDVGTLVNPVRTLKLLLGLVSLAVMVGVGLFTHISTDFLPLCLITGAGILLSAFDMRNVFIARDQLWRVSYHGIIGQLFFVALLFTTVHTQGDVVPYALCSLAYAAIPTAMSLWLYGREFGGMRLTLKYDKWGELARESVPLGFSAITAMVNTYFAGLIVGLYLSTTDLGYFSAGFRLVMIFITIFNLLGTVVVPTISRLYVRDRAQLLRFMQMYFLVSVVIGIGSAIALWIIAEWFVGAFFGANYVSAIPLVKIWAIGLLPLTPLSIFFAGSLIPCNGSKEYFKASVSGAIVSLAGTPLLLHFGGLGAAPYSHIFMELTVATTGAFLLVRKLELSRREALQLFNVRVALRELIKTIRVREVTA